MSLITSLRPYQVPRPQVFTVGFEIDIPMLTGALDARFEVIGAAPCSLLSVSLSASQSLYSRRGTLIGVGGNAENVSV